MKNFVMVLIVLAMLCIGMGSAKATENSFACLTVMPLIYTMCINGYVYTTVQQGCNIVGFTQAFEIDYKKNGKPNMVVPIPCDVQN
jgi:hypothetical protein